MPWYLFLGNTDLNKCILLAIEIRENISIYRWQNLNIVDTKWLDVQVKRNSKKKISRIIWKGANNMYRSWHTSRRTYNKMYRTNSNNNTHTDVVSTLCNVENPTSDFVSFSTSDQCYFNVDPQHWNKVDPTLKCWLGYICKKICFAEMYFKNKI